MAVAKTRAYYSTAAIIAVKMFIIQAPRSNPVKLFCGILQSGKANPLCQNLYLQVKLLGVYESTRMELHEHTHGEDI